MSTKRSNVTIALIFALLVLTAVLLFRHSDETTENVARIELGVCEQLLSEAQKRHDMEIAQQQMTYQQMTDRVIVEMQDQMEALKSQCDCEPAQEWKWDD